MLFTLKQLASIIGIVFILSGAKNSYCLPDELVFREGLANRQVSRYPRAILHTDLIEQQIIQNQWAPPKAGETIQSASGSAQIWVPIQADEQGKFSGENLQNSYVDFLIPSEEEGTMILAASGHDLVYVNGEPHYGDPYSNNYSRIPVQLRKGENEFLFFCRRGLLNTKLIKPKGIAELNPLDTTLPDLLEGEKVDTWGSLVVLNTTPEPLDGLYLSSEMEGGSITFTPVSMIPPRGIRKAGFHLIGEANPSKGEAAVEVRLYQKQENGFVPLDRTSIQLAIKEPQEPHKLTFISSIDNSVQYYAISPKSPINSAENSSPALFLSLHGAGVEAIGQAQAYSSKGWGVIVCPTNRRPYGFDWEDWGRMDALEVLNLTQTHFQTDPQRTYLTGHSMGGHGTWQIGAWFPDRFAAIAPSAGWCSFRTYMGTPSADSDNPMQELLMRASASSDTLALATNYVQQGVYILHGGADDNVPPREARKMKAHLDGFHDQVIYYELPGAGHWWDTSEEPGTDCVDWAPIFDLFARRMIPSSATLREVSFTTVNPGISSSCHWVEILQQEKTLKPSFVQIRVDPQLGRFVGTTGNIRALRLSARMLTPGKAIEVILDGTEAVQVPWPEDSAFLTLAHQDDNWVSIQDVDSSRKGPRRYGPFKEAFNNRFVLVYGTQGSPEENRAILNKVRLDTETFWYRGNGSMDVVADVQFDPSRESDRSVILYGNAQNNSCWNQLIEESPVQVTTGRVQIGDQEIVGDNLACLFIQPRLGSDRALVGVIAGTGLPGFRLTERMPYFISGVGFPDCVVMSPEVLTQGVEGVKAAGFFGLDWGVDTGEFMIR